MEERPREVIDRAGVDGVEDGSAAV